MIGDNDVCLFALPFLLVIEAIVIVLALSPSATVVGGELGKLFVVHRKLNILRVAGCRGQEPRRKLAGQLNVGGFVLSGVIAFALS